MAEDSSDRYPAHPPPRSPSQAPSHTPLHTPLHTIDESPDGSATPAGEEAYGGSGQAPEAPVDAEVLRERVIAALRTIYDPEIPLNIYDLGLIYNVAIDDQSAVEIDMTLTAPGCPVAGPLVRRVAEVVGALEGVSRSHARLVWDPPWTQDRMSEEAQLELGLL